MTSYTRFPRTNNTGVIPAAIDPGSFFVNWADQKLYAGGPSGAAVLVGAPVRDWVAARVYRRQDIVFRDGSLWRANVDFIAAGAFNESQWLRLNDANLNAYAQLVGTSTLQRITPEGFGPISSLTIPSGTGVIVDGTSVTDVTWPTQAFNLTGAERNRVLVIGITATGTAVAVPIEQATSLWRRRNIRVGHFSLSSDGTTVLGYWRGANVVQSTDSDLRDLIDAIGPLKTLGLELQMAGTNAVFLTPGRYWKANAGLSDEPNEVVAAASTPDILTAFRSAYVGSGAIDPSQWDNAGILQAVQATQATIQYVWLQSPGRVVIGYGQSVYTSFDLAKGSVSSDYSRYVVPSVVAPFADLLVGAVITTGDGSRQEAVNVGVRNPFGASGSGGGGTGDFLPRNGSLPMLSDLDLGGFDLINGFVDGAQVGILPELLATTGLVPPSFDGQLRINPIDRKVYVGDEIVADRIEAYSNLREYAAGDLVINGSQLYRSIAGSPPQAFTPSNWTAIGGGGSDPQGSVILLPEDADRNTIDLRPAGGVARAMAVVINNSQSVDIVDYAGRSKIDRFGVPTGAFGETTFAVSQPVHGFTEIGTPIYYDTNNLRWLPASRNAPAEFPTAIVNLVIDQNTFVAQVNGRVNGLSASVFGGVPPVAGTYYFASDTPGQLTATAQDDRLPVLYALSATSALLKLTSAPIERQLTIQDVLKATYPVGAIYSSADPTLPPQFAEEMVWVTEIIPALTSGDTFPTSPDEGDLHYLTVAPVGLYINLNDGDSIQWVQVADGQTSDDFWIVPPGGLGVPLAATKLFSWRRTA